MLSPLKSVVITGASSGIGRTTALYLAARGFKIWAGVRKLADGESLKAEAGQRSSSGSSTIEPIILDVTNTQSIKAAAQFIEAQLGNEGLWGLVNNAGIVVAAPMEFVPLDELRRQLEVNVVGQIAVTQAFLPLLRKARGRIVNIGSVSGIVSNPFVGPYCASKFAMEALTDTLRLELRPFGIEVSIVEPGMTATPIWETSAKKADQLASNLPALSNEYYGAAMGRIRDYTSRQGPKGTPPEKVSRAIYHALSARRPKTRYPIGLEGRLTALMARLPDRLRDRLFSIFV